MKKLLLTTVALLAFGFTNAQEVKFGAKAGLNLSNIAGDDVSDTKARLSFHVGGLAEIKLTDKFAIQPELLYSVQGTKFETGGSDDLVYDLQYINLPIMFKYYVAEKFSLEAGPQVGFLVTAKVKLGDDSEDVKDMFKSTDFGANFGVGYNITENISAGLRYNLGLSNIVDQEGSKAHNSVFSLSAAYKF